MNINKYKVYLLSCALIILLCSCSKKTEVDYTIQSEASFYQYNISDTFAEYDVAPNGYVYLNTMVEIGRTETKTNYDENIDVYDLEGRKVRSYAISNIMNMSVTHNNLFYIQRPSTSNSLEKEIYKLALDSEEVTPIARLAAEINIQKMDSSDDYSFLIGIDSSRPSKSFYMELIERNYNYNGEIILVVDHGTGEVKILDIDYPLSISKTLDGALLIYGYEANKGFYFTVYNPIDQTYSEKTFHDYYNISNIEVYNENLDFIYYESNLKQYSIFSGSIDPNAGRREILSENFIFQNTLRATQEYVYFILPANNDIVRIHHPSILRKNEVLTFVTSSLTKTNVPYGFGYSVKTEYLNQTELALSFLAQDSKYDLFTFHSRQDISGNIRDKGNFYPLNELPAVQEYLDACFPFVREGATSDDGSIWMLPITIDIPVFIYNEAWMKHNDIPWSSEMTIEELLSSYDQIRKNPALKEEYMVFRNIFADRLLQQYQREYNTYDTEEFAILAKQIYSSLNWVEDNSSGYPSLLLDYDRDKDKKFLLLLDPYFDSYQRFLANPELRASKLPSLYNNTASIADCFFIAVNPSGDNLDGTLQYVNSLASFLLSRTNNTMFQDPSLYPDTLIAKDIYKIYENAELTFTYPYDILGEQFKSYLSGTMTLEEMQKESSRKLNIYLNE